MNSCRRELHERSLLTKNEIKEWHGKTIYDGIDVFYENYYVKNVFILSPHSMN